MSTLRGKEGLQSELAARHQRLIAGLAERDATCLVATREASVTYVTGYTTATWSNFSRPIVAVLDGDSGLTVVCAETEADAMNDRIPGVRVRPYVELRRVTPGTPLPDGRVQFALDAAEILDQVIRDVAPSGSVAVDGLRAAFPPVAQLTTLIPALGERLVDASDLMWRERIKKSPWELSRLRTASRVLERAFTTLEGSLRPGLSERQIHGALAAGAFQAGADGLGYVNVVAGTTRGLFGNPTDRTWHQGEVLYVDGGVVVDGYWADFCRMYLARGATGAQAGGYQRAFDGLRAAVSAFMPGMTAGDLAQVIQRAVRLDPSAVGFGRFGHGIGLYMPEPPSLHPADDTELTDGLVLCIEPAVNHEGANYVVEEEYVVEAGRLDLISPPAPPRIIEI